MKTPEDLRGIADQMDGMLHTGRAVKALRECADLLENGQKKRAEQRELSVMPWVLIVPGPGRYLVVPLREDG